MGNLTVIFAAFFTVFGFSNASFPYEPGFDFQYRLPRDWLPITYRLKIFYEESATTVPAELRLRMMAQRPTEKLILNAFSPSIEIKETTIVKFENRKQTEDLGGPIVTKETIKYLLPANIYKKVDYGTIMEVRFKYTFTVNETAYYGPYRSPYYAFNSEYREGNATRIDMFTQMEPFYARRLFPCFDEPEYKAIFFLERFEFRRKSSLKAVVLFNTHGKLLSRTSEKEIWTFPNATPKMSPYLVAILVGSYEDSYTYGPLGGTPPKVTFWYEKDVNLTEPVQQSRRVIGHFEEYLNVKSPIEKFDFAFVPFAFYGMENWGLVGMKNIFSLTGDNGTMSTWSGESVLIHEILHQWFGNAITCRWWTDIWINEGLTSFYTHNYLENVFKPTAEEKKYQRRNVMYSERPIRLSQFGGSWTPAYDRTPWIMKMLEQVMGEEHFLTGIKNLLTDYHYHPVTSDDFFRVFQRVVDNNGIKGWDSEENLDVRKFLYNWLFEGGYPTIKARFNSTSNSFTLSQFHEEGLKWYVPIWFSRTDWDEPWISRTSWLTPKEDLVVEVWSDVNETAVEWDPTVIGFYVVENDNL